MKPFKPSELAVQMMEYLDCPCEVFGPMDDDDALWTAYQNAYEQGKTMGFVPVLVKVDDTLMECLLMNAAQDDGADQLELSDIRNYRRGMLEQAKEPGARYLEHLIQARRQEAEEDEIDWQQEIMGVREQGEACERFLSYWNYQTKETDEMILARIPAEHPWEIFAWLPMGNWNECPDTPELMAVARYWFETHGAVPACVSHDELEFILEAPVGDYEAAGRLALEQYAFCPDRVEQCEEDGSVEKLADTLSRSTVWYFWWD